jgi:hypothetical protein
MSDRWALVNPTTLVVDNVIIWNGGESLWPDLLTVQLDADERCAPGWTYEAGASPRFIEPTPPTE